jgi:hypothetical protein
MHHDVEYTDKLPFDQQREIERRLRQQAVNQEASSTNARQRTLTVTLVLLAALALLTVLDLRTGGNVARAHAATIRNEALAVRTSHTIPAPDQGAVPVAAARPPEQLWAYERATYVAGVYPAIPHTILNTIFGTESMTDTTGTLMVAP